jgi:hypothetical protein
MTVTKVFAEMVRTVENGIGKFFEIFLIEPKIFLLSWKFLGEAI